MCVCVMLTTVFSVRMWSLPEYKEISRTSGEVEQIRLNSDGCNLNLVSLLSALVYRTLKYNPTKNYENLTVDCLAIEN